MPDTSYSNLSSNWCTVIDLVLDISNFFDNLNMGNFSGYKYFVFLGYLFGIILSTVNSLALS